jgi:hypothetical protein
MIVDSRLLAAGDLLVPHGDRHRQLFSRCRPYPSGTGSRDAYNSLRN